jgi:hypothetical protein
MKTDTDSVSLVVESTDGRPLRAYKHEGKAFIESHENRTYQLRVKNKTGNRVKAVIAVDSLNILTGKPATDDPGETGYVLNPYAEEVFKGYRLDDSQVAAFTFVKREKSYATEAGEGQGNGVIAIRAYAEKTKKPDMAEVWRKMYEDEKNKPREKEYIPYRPWYWEDHYWYPKLPYFGDVWCGGYSKCGTTGALGDGNVYGGAGSTQFSAGNLTACAQNASTMAFATTSEVTSSTVELKAQSFDMGSSWGSLVKEAVTHTEFEAGNLIAELVVFYASLDSLKTMGVNVSREKAVAFPEPFKRQYATPPKDWISGKA